MFKIRGSKPEKFHGREHIFCRSNRPNRPTLLQAILSNVFGIRPLCKESGKCGKETYKKGL